MRSQGKWIAGVFNYNGEYHIGVGIEGEDKITALCGGAGAKDEPESIANAQLIAASPKLLACLEKLMPLWAREDISDEWNDQFQEAFNAIKEAKGE